MEQKKEVATGVSTILVSFIIKFVVDYPINVIILNLCGYILSVIIITFINLLICIIFVKIYDNSQKDIYFFEKAKSKKGKINLSKNIPSYINKWFKMGKSFLLFVVLSIKIPFLMVICFREGPYLYNGFSGRKIKLLIFLSVLVVSIGWNMILYFGFSLWNYLKSI